MKIEASNPIPKKEPISTEAENVSAKSDFLNTKNLEGAGKENFILEHMKMIRGIASKMAMRLSPNIDVQDLIQIGVEGLMDAMNRYDHKNSSRASFSTFAGLRIRGAMLDALRKEDHLSDSVRRKIKKIHGMLEKNRERIAGGLESLSDEEIAKKLGLDIKTYRELLILATGGVVSLDQFLKVKKNSKKNVFINEAKNPEEIASKNEILEQFSRDNEVKKEKVKVAAEQFFLSIKDRNQKSVLPVWRDIYEKYYIQRRSMKDISHDYDTTESTISQKLKKIRKGIEDILKPQGLKLEDIDWDS